MVQGVTLVMDVGCAVKVFRAVKVVKAVKVVSALKNGQVQGSGCMGTGCGVLG